MRTLTFALVVALAAAAAPVRAELTVAQIQKLLSADGAADDWFGWQVSVDGDTALIGVPRDSDRGAASGSAYVFVREDGVWTQQAKLVPDDGAATDRFGQAVALDGETALIGATGTDSDVPNCGSAYVFVRRHGAWTQQAKLLADDGAAQDGLGNSVSLSGDTALIAALGADDNGEHSGKAYVFVRDDGVWTQQARLLPDDGAMNDVFGQSVSVDGDGALIGAPGTTGHGKVYVFVREAGVWTQQAELLPDDGFFGIAVSLDGDTALISGAVAGDGYYSFAAYVFTLENGMWMRQAKLQPDDGTPGEAFGISLALDGDTALIGSSGLAYVFTRSDDAWTQQARLVPDDAAASGSFGREVALSGSTALVGAVLDDDNGDDSGSAYVFRILRNPLDRIDALRDRVRSLDLDGGIENGLLAELDSALLILTDLVARNDHAAVLTMRAFIRQVEAQAGRYIGAADADGLIEAAAEIIEDLKRTESHPADRRGFAEAPR